MFCFIFLAAWRAALREKPASMTLCSFMDKQRVVICCYYCRSSKVKADKILSLQLHKYFQVEGKGNGIKTVIVNMVEIAKALQRPASCKEFFFAAK